MANDIGKNIRAIRDSLGLTGAHVSRAIGLSRPYYTQLEGGTRRLSAEHVRKIAEVLGVPVGELYEGPRKGGGRKPKGKPKHLIPLNTPELRRRLKPLLGEHTGDAVQCIHMLVSAPKEMKEKVRELKREMANQRR